MALRGEEHAATSGIANAIWAMLYPSCHLKKSVEEKKAVD